MCPVQFHTDFGWKLWRCSQRSFRRDASLLLLQQQERRSVLIRVCTDRFALPNYCTHEGTGGAVQFNSTILISGCGFTNTQSSFSGGAISTFGGRISITITSSSFYKCSSETMLGGALYIALRVGGIVTIQGSSFVNTNALQGGAIYVE